MTAPAAEKWHLHGDWFDSCKCTIPCPCTFAQPPTYGGDGVLVWHIRDGHYGDTALDGLNVVMLGYFAGIPGRVKPGMPERRPSSMSERMRTSVRRCR